MTTRACRKKRKKHTPITSRKQARFFGAEYGRKKRGQRGRTKMSKAILKRHLKEWGRKKRRTRKRKKRK